MRVLRRVAQLFDRYAFVHGEMALPGFPLLDADGRLFGIVERIALTNGQLVAEGWALADEVGLTGPDQSARRVPDRPRDDVLAAHSLASGTPGFALALAPKGGQIGFWALRDGVRHVHPLPAPGGGLARKMRLRLLGPFLRDAIRALPAAARWYLRRDPVAIAQIKTILGLNVVPRARQLDTRLFAPAEAGVAAAPVTIILPVFNAFDLLPEVLDRVLRNTDLPWRLIVVEDCSTDPQVRPWLRRWLDGLGPDRDRVTLIENEVNLGFIRSVNRAFAAAIPQGDHVILLNSDAFVPAGWASRLIAPILGDETVASVTPMSNDAEIFTAPVICQRGPLVPGEADAIDLIAQRFAPAPALAEAPTGVGFCMAMNIAFLRRIPEFDIGFGRGYGEEVDWCQRARALGGRHLGTARLFVEHRGGTSFGSAEKLKLVQANNAIVARRYPAYDREVQDFIRHDPLATPRLALALGWAAARQRGAVPVYLAHDMGGGAEMYLQRRIEEDLQQDAAVVVLRVGGQSRWQIEVHTPQGITRGETDETGLVQDLLALLTRRHVVYSCGVGDRDPLALPALLVALAQGPDDTVEVLIHDYLPLSPSYTLLGQDGAYHGVPDAQTNTDPAHETRRPDGTPIPLAQWRAGWGGLFHRADQVTVFSENSRRLVAEAYPEAAARIVVKPHKLLAAITPVAPGTPRDGVPVIGVLGNIGYPKGAAVLRDLSRELARTGAARIVVIGNIDPAFPLAPPSEVHGSYRIAEIPALVARYGISRWLIPSIWPETFSYATHEALATGLPVFAFDLGAQGDAVSAAAAITGLGGVLPIEAAPGQLLGPKSGLIA